MDHTISIADLNPSLDHCAIKVRVTKKTSINSFKINKGKLFRMNFVDNSGEIEAIVFSDLCDRFYKEIEVDNVYLVSNFIIKPYEFTTSGFQLRFTNVTTVVPCPADYAGVPEIQYNFIPLSQVENFAENSPLDIIGVCKKVGELEKGYTRGEWKKRELTLVDMTNIDVKLILWGNDAEVFNDDVKSVVLLKWALINEYRGYKSLKINKKTILKINPDIPEGRRLRDWFHEVGRNHISEPLWLTFKDALASGDAKNFQCKAVVHSIKTDHLYYRACPQPNCVKKVEEYQNQYLCKKCDTIFSNYKHVLRMEININDGTAKHTATCFNLVAEKLLGCETQAIVEALERDILEAEVPFMKILFRSFIFKLNSKMEIYDGQPRHSMIVESASPINYREYNHHLIENIKALTGVGTS